MRTRGAAAVLLAPIVLGGAPIALTAAGTAAQAAPTPSGTSVAAPAVPPSAPTPTDAGRSPAAPDPHPPAGGIGPDGRPVGGSALLHRGLVLPQDAPALPRQLSARAWIVVDLDSGSVIAARDPHGRYQPASIQKVLTCLTLLPSLPGDRRVTVSERAARTEGSHAGLVAGGRYTIDQIFRALLLVSGNDAAEALADAAGGRTKTLAMMNAQAQRLGAYDTYVQTPSGLDGWQQLTSAYDMALVLQAALAQPRFVAYDRAPSTTLPWQRVNGFGPVRLVNQNELFLKTVKGAIVAKTGFTDAAQHTFTGAIARGGHRYGVVLLRAQRWPLDQWQQANALVRWANRLAPDTAPVGQLVGPVAAAPASGTPAAFHRLERAMRPSETGVPIPVVLLIGLAVIASGVVFGQHLRRRVARSAPRR